MRAASSAIGAVSCPICKFSVLFTYYLSFILDPNWLVTTSFAMPMYQVLPFYGYSSLTLNGLMVNEYMGVVMPMVGDWFTGEHICTFLLEVCGQKQWEKIDLDEWIFDLINEKKD